MKIFPALFILLCCGNSTAQSVKSYYFGTNNKPLDNASGAITRLDIHQQDTNFFQVQSFQKKTTEWSVLSTEKVRIKSANEYIIRRYIAKVHKDRINRTFEPNGDSLYTFTDKYMGKVLRHGSSSSRIPLILQNEVIEYYESGQIKSKSLFDENQLISNESWKPNGDQYIENVFYSVDSRPSYPGGDAVLHNHLHKQIMKKSHIFTGYAGTVIVRFVVMENGETTGVYVENWVQPEFDQLVVEAVTTLPEKWEPGVLNGKNVRYSLSIPINFLQAADSHLFDYLEYNNGVLFW